METKKLPNVTIALVLGILSFIACCFTGFGGLVLSGIALYLTNKDGKLLAQDPDGYDNAGQLKTAKVVAIIGLVLAIIISLFMIVFIVMFGWEALLNQELMLEKMQELQNQ